MAKQNLAQYYEEKRKLAQLLENAPTGFFPMNEATKAQMYFEHEQKLYGNAYTNETNVAKAANWFAAILKKGD
jgi:hypothetical protein